MKKTIFIIFSIVLIVICCVITYRLILNVNQQAFYYDTIVGVEGHILDLKDHGKAQLAGTYIPTKDDTNYIPQLREYSKDILLDKKAKIKLILKKDIDYPIFDLVEVYIDNEKESVNEKLLREGMAFFDHGYYKNKDYYYNLQKQAERNNAGIWQDKNKLRVLYIGSKHWWDFHYAECPEIQKINEKDRIYYYFAPPVIFYYRGFDIDCKYCKEIEKKIGIDRNIEYRR